MHTQTVFCKFCLNTFFCIIICNHIDSILLSARSLFTIIFERTEFSGRGRHKHNMFSQLLMFALIAAGVIVIPMGFQFLAILGGKALLLAKMALLMTSIQGLKKIATSNLNYGLYSTHSQGPCKDASLSYDCDPLGHRDNVLVSVDFEDLSGSSYDAY